MIEKNIVGYNPVLMSGVDDDIEGVEDDGTHQVELPFEKPINNEPNTNPPAQFDQPIKEQEPIIEDPLIEQEQPIEELPNEEPHPVGAD